MAFFRLLHPLAYRQVLSCLHKFALGIKALWCFVNLHDIKMHITQLNLNPFTLKLSIIMLCLVYDVICSLTLPQLLLLPLTYVNALACLLNPHKLVHVRRERDKWTLLLGWQSLTTIYLLTLSNHPRNGERRKISMKIILMGLNIWFHSLHMLFFYAVTFDTAGVAINPKPS